MRESKRVIWKKVERERNRNSKTIRERVKMTKNDKKRVREMF